MVCFALPASASGTAFYVSPGGDGPFPCNKSDPCPLSDAVSAAGDGDEISMAAGTYDVGTDYPQIYSSPYIHGPRTGPPATIVSSGSAGLFVLGDPRISDLTIRATSGNGLFVDGAAEVERLRVSANINALACLVPRTPGYFRDSSCVNEGAGPAVGASVSAGAPLTYSYEIANVTAIATGAGASAAGISAQSGLSFTADLHVSNSIAQGGPTASSISAENTGGSAHSNIAVDHTNYAQSSATAGSQVTPGAGNQGGAAPSFVSATSGDYRQLPDSPTIDAGTKDNGFLPIGPFDFTGEKRVFAGKPDIGADEFVGVLSAKAGHRQKLGKLKVKATCLLTVCKLKASGKVKVGSGRHRVTGKLVKATAKGSDGKARTLRLRLRRKDRSKVSKALRHRSGKASIVVKSSGEQGIHGAKRLRVTVH
ncbi:hypothetical protein BH10ACT11_BH10ACT11_06250 [soil metagenome]